MDPTTQRLMMAAAGDGNPGYPVLVGNEGTPPVFGTVTSRALTMPANLLSGDLLVAVTVSSSGTSSLSLPAGWLTAAENTSGSPSRLKIFTRTAGASEPASVNLSSSVSSVIGGVILAFRFGTLDVVGSESGTGGVASGLTASRANSLLLGAWSDEASYGFVTGPTGMDLLSGNSGTFLSQPPSYRVHSQLVAAGATGTRTALFDGAARDVSAFLLSIRPNP